MCSITQHNVQPAGSSIIPADYKPRQLHHHHHQPIKQQYKVTINPNTRRLSLIMIAFMKPPRLLAFMKPSQKIVSFGDKQNVTFMRPSCLLLLNPKRFRHAFRDLSQRSVRETTRPGCPFIGPSPTKTKGSKHMAPLEPTLERVAYIGRRMSYVALFLKGIRIHELRLPVESR